MNLFRSMKIVGAWLCLVFSLLCLMVSCTKESMDECRYYIRFRYDYNMEFEDLFADHVEQVKVFAFDKNGRYLETFTRSGEELKSADFRVELPYDMYECQAIVWAGRTDELYTLPKMNLGDTITKLNLIYHPESLVSDKRIENLWHAGPVEMKFPDQGKTTQTIDLLRLSNDIVVVIKDKFDNFISDNYKVDIMAANGTYDYHNNYLPENPIMTYRPYSFDSVETNPKARLRTLRIKPTDNVSLTIKDQSGTPIEIGGSTVINLADYFVRSCPAGMPAQEYFDRCYNWELSFIVGRSAVLAIMVNGWVYWFQEVDV